MYGTGFGAMTPEDVFALQQAMSHQRMRKAITAGYNEPGTVGNALVPQSMEKTLASATYRNSDAICWKKMPKVNVNATVSEFNRIETHGNRNVDGWFAEGGSPMLAKSTYTRDFTRVKYIGVKGATTFPMMHSKIVGPNANAEAEEVARKTDAMIGLLEDALYFGDSRNSALAFDGLRATLEINAPANIVDQRGKVLTGRQMRTDMALQRDLHAQPTVVVMSHGARAVLGNLEDPAIRRNDPAGRGAKIGTKAEGVNADHGYVPFESTYFLTPKGTSDGLKIEPEPSVLVAPTIAAWDGDAGDNGDFVALAGSEVSQWTDSEAGTYFYRVQAVGDGGVSAARDSVGIVVTTGGGKKAFMELDDGTNDPSEGGTNTRYYRVFRSSKDAADADDNQFLRNVPAAAVGTLTVIEDFNDDLPGTSWAFSIQMTPDVVEIVRLLDMMKQDLAIRTTTKEFLLICFAAFRSRTPSKLWAWKNCAQSL